MWDRSVASSICMPRARRDSGKSMRARIKNRSTQFYSTYNDEEDQSVRPHLKRGPFRLRKVECFPKSDRIPDIFRASKLWPILLCFLAAHGTPPESQELFLSNEKKKRLSGRASEWRRLRPEVSFALFHAPELASCSCSIPSRASSRST